MLTNITPEAKAGASLPHLSMEVAMHPIDDIYAVLWDLGGVLVQTDDPTPRSALADRFEMSVQELEHLVFYGESARQAQLGRLTTYEQWEQVGSALHLTGSELSEVKRQFWAGQRVDPDLMVFIRGLRPFVRTALVSNAFSDLRQTLSQRWQIADSFDEIIISAEVGVRKPDPRIFRLALERLRVEPWQAVLVDNDPENVASARSLGIQTVQYENNSQVMCDVMNLMNAVAAC